MTEFEKQEMMEYHAEVVEQLREQQMENENERK